MKIKPEAKLVEEIVKDILTKLKDKSFSSDFKGLVGLSSRIEAIKSLLGFGLTDFPIGGIWGMGGIGKTTIVGAIYSQLSCAFEGKCFMANVREESEKGGGLLHLRDQILSQILEENLKIRTPEIPQNIKERLQKMKVFMVLDDVNKFRQLEYLAGGLDRFGPVSRIIVTTRDKQVLDIYEVDNIYEVREFNYNEALELFCNYAFKQNHPCQDLIGLSSKVINFAQGNPLALKVFGSSLYQKSKQEWKNAFHYLKQISHPDIFDVLKISYDELNWEEKNIFLDIACFFKGEEINHVSMILADQYCIHYGLKALVDKSFIKILGNKLQMHDLLQEMGREIVHQEYENEPGKRSRLWYHEDICRVLKKNKGTDSIEGIFLDLSKIRELHIGSGALSNMSNLRLLKFYMPKNFDVSDMSSKVHLPQGLDYLSDELRYLHWYRYPSRTLPMNFNPENLIELSLAYSKVQQLWKGKKEAFKLKSIDLQHSHDLTRIPDPSATPNLQKISLLNCISLSLVPLNIQNFNNLGKLCLEGCKSISYFPSNIHFKSPIQINFSSCINLTKFPEISGNIIDLDLQYTAIEVVPSSIESLTSLEKLTLSNCKRLASFSTSICKLKSLRKLYLDYCSKFESFPEILEKMERLGYVDLSSTKIKELPSSIEHLHGLIELRLRDCLELDSLPESLGNLKSLKFIFGEELSFSDQLPSSITNLNELERLPFYRCRGLVLPPFSGLSNLTALYLSGRDITEIPQDIGCLSSLERLDLRRNNFKNLPSSIKQLSRLISLYLSDCYMLQSLPELPHCLQTLGASNCKRLQSLPELPAESCLEILDTSILERLSHSSHTSPCATIEFTFSNCLKLNEDAHNILADSGRRIQYMAIASLKHFHLNEEEFTEPLGISICLPGSGIPDWFRNRSSGSSVTI